VNDVTDPGASPEREKALRDMRAARVAQSAAPEWAGDSCFICGDGDDHDGLPHSVATGDGRDRRDAIIARVWDIMESLDREGYPAWAIRLKKALDINSNWDGEPLYLQVRRLGTYIIDHVPGEPSQSEGAVDTAIRLLTDANTIGAFDESELGAGTHVADVGENGYVIEHSLACRRSGLMTQCPFIGHMPDAIDEFDLAPGRYQLEILPQVGFSQPERLQLDRLD
jgi:hypothetical protein